MPIRILLTGGNTSSSPDRRMSRGSDNLNYNLYLDPLGTTVWGDGSRGSMFYNDPAPRLNTNITVPVYARIPARQHDAAVGAYSDTIIVTIQF